MVLVSLLLFLVSGSVYHEYPNIAKHFERKCSAFLSQKSRKKRRIAAAACGTRSFFDKRLDFFEQFVTVIAVDVQRNRTAQIQGENPED
jgi:hypothetical protein